LKRKASDWQDEEVLVTGNRNRMFEKRKLGKFDGKDSLYVFSFMCG
jgi:hypothetical protein